MQQVPYFQRPLWDHQYLATAAVDPEARFDDELVPSKRCRVEEEVELTTNKNFVTKRLSPIYVDEASGHQYLPHDVKKNFSYVCKCRCGGRGTVRIDEEGKMWLKITAPHGTSSICPNEDRSPEDASNAIESAVLRNKVLHEYEQHLGSVKQLLERKNHELYKEGKLDLAAGYIACNLQSAGSRRRLKKTPKVAPNAASLMITHDYEYIVMQSETLKVVPENYLLSNNQRSQDHWKEGEKEVKFVQYYFTWNGKSIIICCTDDTFTDMWVNGILLFSDGTFSIVPALFLQLYTIQYMKAGKLIPCVWILATHKDAETYDVIINWMKTRAAELQLGDMRCESIGVDYEKAWINAWRKAFPSIRIHGCYFHFVQAVYRYMMVECGLRPAYFSIYNKKLRDLINRLISIPFLEVHEYDDAFSIVSKSIIAYADDKGRLNDEKFFSNERAPEVTNNDATAEGNNSVFKRKVTKLLDYFQKQWLKDAEMRAAISVYGREHRTSNLIEGFHFGLQTQLKSQTNFYTFIKFMQKEELNVRILRHRAEVLQLPIANKKSPFNKDKDAKIDEITNDYKNKTITMDGFLQAIADTRKSSHLHVSTT
jgi:hypothetical protein